MSYKLKWFYSRKGSLQKFHYFWESIEFKESNLLTVTIKSENYFIQKCLPVTAASSY